MSAASWKRHVTTAVSNGPGRSQRVPLSCLGGHRLTAYFVFLQSAIAATCLLLSGRAGLTIAWRTGTTLWIWDAVLLLLWGYFVWAPGRPRDWIMAESTIALALTLILSHILSPAQYLAAAFNRPLIDPWLAAADTRLGIYVPDLVKWSLAHPRVDHLQRLAYSSLLPQLAVVIVLLGIVQRDRLALWEYVFHFHVCATITVVALALLPAACAFQYYGIDSTINQTRFIAQFNGVRAGTFHVIRFDNLEGLISMPSFHVAGALMITWAVRQSVWLWPFLIVNAILIASTVMTGAHYAIDLPVTALMFAGSVALWRIWGVRLLGDMADCTER